MIPIQPSFSSLPYLIIFNILPSQLMIHAQDLDSAHVGVDIFDVKTDGDVIIGGLFPMHEDGSAMGRHCAAIKPDKGIQRMEAMLWAVEKINRDRKLLPGIKLGVHILDTCHQDTHGLEQTLEFIKTSMSASTNGATYTCSDGSKPAYDPPKRVVAVIGAANSQVSAMVANVLRLFKMPQISYSSTSTELSDKSRFEFFSRVVPPDDLQAEAMVDVVSSLGWTYVAAVADEGNYGEQGMEQFRNLATAKKICVAPHEKIRRNHQDKDFIELVLKLLKTEANGVVMFVNEDNVKKILKAISDLDLSINQRFAFVASDSWGNKRTPVTEHPMAAIGAITIQPKVTLINEFDRYFTRLTPRNHKLNKWFGEFWMDQFNCTTLNKECLANSLTTNHLQESYVPYVVDAVYVLAHALDEMIRQHCLGKPFRMCSLATEGFNGTELLEHIKNVSFEGPQGEEIRLNEHGDRMGRYNIYQFRGFREQYVPVGIWSNNNRLSLNMSLIQKGYLGHKIPRSVCGDPCQRNQYRSMSRDQCCWTCQDCNASSIMPNDSICIPCELGYLPHEVYRNECLPMKPQTMEWLTLWSIIPCCFSSMGIILTIFVFGVFLKYNKTPVIMASGRELCYMMLFGILLAYLMTFVLLHPPNWTTCGLQRLGLGTTLSIVYASILTKTSRLARIFTNNVRSMQRPKFISPRAQVIICTLLISGQLIGAIIWITVEPPRTTRIYPTRMESVLSCKVTAIPTLLSLTYILLLISLCTLYAFKTRKIPENFNETKHIGFTMYATCIIWLAFVPIYFGTNNNFKIQITSMCMCISISASVALACFFAPKVYLVLFQPNKNVRPSANMSSFQKLQIGMVQQQMRFLRPKSDYESTIPASQASQYSTLIGPRSASSANGEVQRVEGSTSIVASGVITKRRRSSALKSILPQSESRHNRVGAVSISNNNGNVNLNNSSLQPGPLDAYRNSLVLKNKNTNILNVTSNSANGSQTARGSLSSVSSNSSRTRHKGSTDESKPIRSVSPEPTSVTQTSGNSGKVGNGNEKSEQERASMEVKKEDNESEEEEEDESAVTDFLLATPSTPIAWTMADPRSEFEIILTEISSQEGTFV